MKKFTESSNEKQLHYAGNDVLKNQLYDIIVETLTPNIDGVSDNLSISGIDDLVNEFVKIIENANIDSSIDILKQLKPEKNEEKLDPLMEAFKEVNSKNNDED